MRKIQTIPERRRLVLVLGVEEAGLMDRKKSSENRSHGDKHKYEEEDEDEDALSSSLLVRLR